MKNKARETLHNIIAQYGHSICDYPKRCESLLRDFCPECRREINILINALKAKITEDLKDGAGLKSDPALLIARLVKRLYDEIGIAEEFALWAVESWAYALGVYLPETSASSSQRDGDRIEHKTYEPVIKPEIGYTNRYLGMKFVCIPPGTFIMGSPPDEPGRSDDEHQHTVKLTTGFYLQTTQITQRQWKAVMGKNPASFRNCIEDCPIESVSYEDVQEFIRRLNQRDKSYKYRLPTEAEWEYACRAGTESPFSFGKCLSSDQANYNGNYPFSDCMKGEYRRKTIPVGSLAPNNWGLYDMHGNVWEWVQDTYSRNIYKKDQTDPVCTNRGANRVIRGGGWFAHANSCRSAARSRRTPVLRGDDIGFRLARSL